MNKEELALKLREVGVKLYDLNANNYIDVVDEYNSLIPSINEILNRDDVNWSDNNQPNLLTIRIERLLKEIED